MCFLCVSVSVCVFLSLCVMCDSLVCLGICLSICLCLCLCLRWQGQKGCWNRGVRPGAGVSG